MIIYGAGLAGLLAGNIFRRLEPVIREIQPALPNNHHALLRFRTDTVSRALGIPFHQVHVQKAISLGFRLHTETNLRMNNMYSLKVTGRVMERSILNLEPGMRWIAPVTLIDQMSNRLNIQYDSPIKREHIELHRAKHPEESVISTIPMPALMELMGWEDPPEFPHQGICTVSTWIDAPEVDVYQTVYYPDPTMPYYRASLMGRVLLVEMTVDRLMDWEKGTDNSWIHNMLLSDFGIREVIFTKPLRQIQKYGKLQPTDETVRKQFIVAMSDLYGIYSLGRFATWRQILLDDLVQDCHHIESFMMDRSSYQRRQLTIK